MDLRPPRDQRKPNQQGTRGRFARPDRNRRIYDPDVTCAACRQCGHPASCCDMLAMALFLEKYMKRDLSKLEREKVESAWLDRWKDRLGNPSRLPSKVMKAYLEYMDMSSTMLDEQMEWECWPHTDDVDQEQDELAREEVDEPAVF